MAIIVGLLVLMGGVGVPCVDCHPMMQPPSDHTLTVESCCATECPMEEHEACGLVDDESQEPSKVAVLASSNVDQGAKQPERTIESGSRSALGLSAVRFSMVLDERSSHDPPQPPLTILHSQFLI